MSDPSRPTEFSATSELDQLPDRDTEETAEWQVSLDAVVRNAGPDRAVYLLRRVHEYAARSGIALPGLLSSDYINTIPTSEFDKRIRAGCDSARLAVPA
jgi:pyruvate dehydrogenase E1 component